MKYVPNRTKVCKYCGKTILYNEEYICVDRLDASNNVSTDTRHSFCASSFSAGLSGMQPFQGGSWAANAFATPAVQFSQQQQLAQAYAQASKQASLRQVYKPNITATQQAAIDKALAAQKKAIGSVQKYKNAVTKYYEELANTLVGGGTNAKENK